MLLFRHERFAARLVRHVAVVGMTGAGLRMSRRLAETADFQVLGLFDDAAEPGIGVPAVSCIGEFLVSGAGDRSVSGGDIDSLIDRSRLERLDAIIVALPYERRAELPALCARLRTVLADVYVAPHLLDGADLVFPEARLGPYLLSVAQRRPLDDWQIIQKDVFDRVLGAIVLTLALPVLLAVALAIRLDSPGPVIFRQTRLGLKNRPFTLFKFRTMRHEAADAHADRQTSRGDGRVTAVGRILRKLSLDELPQLLNVLRGEMSLVGPRPHALNTRAGGKLLGDALAEYVIRNQIKPGITGWAQVNGARGELTTLEQLRTRVHLDLDYMRRWSLLFDLRVILLTVTREIFSSRAY